MADFVTKIKITGITIEKIENNELIKELPEIYQLKAVMEKSDWHQEAVFDHTLRVLKNLRKITKNLPPKIVAYLNQKITRYRRKNLLFLGALFHDIGKKETFSNHAERGAVKTKKILNRFDLSDKEKEIVTKIVKNHSLIHDILDPKNVSLEKDYKKFKYNCSDIFLELILLGIADTKGSFLQVSKPDEYRFRISYYENILNGYRNYKRKKRSKIHSYRKNLFL